mgnify:CR=1 FL=1
MSVTEESGGRLNAFAKEPKVEVIQQGYSLKAMALIVLGGLLVIGLIAFSSGLT